jgi:A/G-specific adenine glycosylase
MADVDLDKKIKFSQREILKWFKENGRSFPWREEGCSNYELIIAEILLQRTKAETVDKFFPVFIEKYPGWVALGRATEQELVDFLQPIGLNKQRGKRLFQLAQELKTRNYTLPKKVDEVNDLPMIGQYITNAFELFILKKKAPLLDVNMARVLERFFGPRKLKDIRYDPYLQDLAHQVIKHPKSKELNWGIIDFAYFVCNQKPKCYECRLGLKCNFLTKNKVLY